MASFEDRKAQLEAQNLEPKQKQKQWQQNSTDSSSL
jgi:hypothetical protein